MPKSDSYIVFTKIQSRQLGAASPMSIVNAARGSNDFIKRLGKWRVLTGHEGCVNTIAWNESGDKILSGSDDCRLNIYDVGRNKRNLFYLCEFCSQGFFLESHILENCLLESIRSGHRANIFSARFLPASSDRKIVSCCGGGMVHYNEVGIDTYHGQNYFNCHSGTTYELTIIPGDPNSFLTCGEDGTIRHFDLRVKSNCYCQECRDDILIERQNAITSIMVNPIMPYHLAVGCEDSIVRIYDMRAICTEKERSNLRTSGRHESGIISLLKPPHLKKSSCRVTSLRYNETGSEILVSYCTDYVYLFSTNIQRKATCSALGSGKALRNRVNGATSDDSSKNLPPVKRLRLRGDWSDTGPNARPENEQDREENNTNSLMQRISDVFSRWLEDAFNESTNRPTDQSDTNEDGDDRESISGTDTPGNADGSPSPPQPSACQNSEAVECTVDNVQPLKDDDINPVEDMVEVLDLGGSDASDSVSHFHVGNREKPAAVVLDEVVNNDCEAGNPASLLDRFQKQGEMSSVRDALIDNDGKINNSVESQQALTGSQLCTCGSDTGLFEESYLVGHSSSLDSNKVSTVNGNRASGSLSLSEAKFEEQNTSAPHLNVEKRTTICRMKKGTFGDVGDSISAKPKDYPINSLVPSEDLGAVVETDEVLDSQNTPEAKRSFSVLNNCDVKSSDKKCKDDSESNSPSADNAGDGESNDIGVVNEHDKVAEAGGDEPKGIELDRTTEKSLNCKGTECNDHSIIHGEYTEQLLTNCNSSDSKKETCNTVKGDGKIYDIDENPGDIGSTLAEEGSNDHNSERSSSVNVDAEMEENSKNDRFETVISTASLPERGADNQKFDGMRLSTGSVDCSLHERSLGEDESVQNTPASNHITEVESVVRPGTSDESNGREVPSETRADVTSAMCIGPLRDVSARRRHAAATRIQRCFRLQKKKSESCADSEEDFMNNFEMPTPIMCYKGHRNARTMIKEANFWGDRYVISGSDCGRVFIWDKQTGDLVVLLEGDKHVVNCVQPHPFDPILATSGIDYDIKVWAPVLESPAVLTNVEEIISRNEQMLEESRDTITVPASFMLRMLASLSRVRGQRRSQQQDESNSNDESDD